jgi:Tol biopolymer transport system component
MLPPDTATLTAGEAPVVSPDGRHVAFVATDHTGTTLLYVRDRETLVARALSVLPVGSGRVPAADAIATM